MFRDLDGIHVPNSFDGKRLHKAILNRSANGEIQYDNELEDVIFDDETKYSIDEMGNAIIEFLVGDVDVNTDLNLLGNEDLDISREDDAFDDKGNSSNKTGDGKSGLVSSSSSGSNSNLDEFSMDSTIFHIFDGVVSPELADKALRIFFMFKPVNKIQLGKFN